MKNLTLKNVVFMLCLALWGSASLWAQDVAQVAGAVHDSTGASVAGATVRITQTDTQAVRAAVTGADGGFVFPNLPLGPYELQVVKEGFTTYVQQGIVLQVNSNPQINPVLTVGAVTQSVAVQADAAMVETHDNSVGQVIDSQQVLDLPLNGRQVSQLITLSGASVINTTSALSTNFRTYPNAIAISVAGGGNNSTTFLLDGGINMDPSTNVPMLLPFPDAILEFKMETTAVPAEYGYHPGAVVSVATKSGTNQLHASLFEFLRNGDLNATQDFTTTKDSLKRNQFGGTIGDKIIRNKLFFFAAYQDTIIKTDPANNIAYTPNAQVLAGNFSTITSSQCATGKVQLNATRFPNEQIPLSQLNPQALNLLKYLPVSTDPCGKVLYGIVSNSTDEQGLGRLDYQKSDKQNIFARYFVGENDEPAVNDPTDILTSNRSGWSDMDQAATVGHTYIVSPSALNSFRLTFTRAAVTRSAPPSLPTPTSLGVNMTSLQPDWLLISVTNYFAFPNASQANGRFKSSAIDITDDYQIIKGTHQFKFGVDYIHDRLNGANNYLQNGQIGFNGTLTGNALGDFMTGSMTSMNQGYGQFIEDRENNIALYAMDTWKPRSSLSVNVGVRWAPYMPVYSAAEGGVYSHFDPAWMLAGIKSTVYPNAPAGLLFPGDKLPGGGTYPGTSPTFGRLNQWEPRVGIVWDPRGKGNETIRIGYGIVHDVPAMWDTSHYSLAPPWGDEVSLADPPGGFSNPWLGIAGGNPYPAQQPPSPSTIFPLEAAFENYPLHVKPLYMESWNVSLQKQFKGNLLVTANYIGNGTTHVRLGTYANPAVYIPGNCAAGQYGLTAAGACSTVANQNFRRVLTLEDPSQGQYISTMIQADDGATQNYEGLLLSANKRLSHHVSALVNYTYAHCLSEGDVTQDTGPDAQDQNNRRGNYGNCVQPNQLFNASVILTSPTFKSIWENAIFGGWQLPIIITRSSGMYATVTTGSDNSLTATGMDRPNYVPGVSPTLTNPTTHEWFNTAAFVANPLGTFGDVGVQSIKGPGQFDIDLSVVRRFELLEHHTFEFRAEMFNIMNHPNLGMPATALNSSTFGQITTALPNPRVIQLVVKYSF